MLRRAASRSAVLRSPAFAPSVLARNYAVLESGGKFGEREKAVEDRAIKNHDLELLKKLRETLGIQEDQPIPESVVGQVSSSSSSSSNINPFAQRAAQSQTSSSAHSRDEHVTREEFLEFRKEIVQRLRNLEDDIMDLQMRRK